MNTHPELSHLFGAEECDVSICLVSLKSNNIHQDQTSCNHSAHLWETCKNTNQQVLSTTREITVYATRAFVDKLVPVVTYIREN